MISLTSVLPVSSVRDLGVYLDANVAMKTHVTAVVRLCFAALRHCNDFHRLCGSTSPGLTATHHSYGSPRLSDFFPSWLWGSDSSTDIHAKWLKRHVVTQGCAICSKSRYFSYPLISRPPKRSKFCKFLDLENFRSIWPLTLQVTERTPLILHQSPMKVA